MISRFLLLCVTTFAFLSPADADEAAWAALAKGGYTVLIRHAVTEPGTGDPPQFKLGDCSTQRNLSAQGRKDAVRLGEEFRRRGVPVAEVLSSRWCRCIDTAKLAFGKVTPVPMLDSMFGERGAAGEKKIGEVVEAAKRPPANGNVVMVTHNQNIYALTGISTGSGEAVVATVEGGKLKTVGRIDLFDR